MPAIVTPVKRLPVLVSKASLPSSGSPRPRGAKVMTTSTDSPAASATPVRDAL